MSTTRQPPSRAWLGVPEISRDLGVGQKKVSGWIDSGSSTEPSVRVAVPVRVLKPQHYTLDLTGRGTGGPEVAGSYVFEIMAR